MQITKNKNKKTKKPSIKKTQRICSIGQFNISLTLKLPDSFFESHKLDFNNINSVKNLSFISEDKGLWDQIVLKSKHQTFNFLLFLNKAEVVKSYIEFIPSGVLTFLPETEFFKEIIISVLNRNNISLVESPINDTECCEILFELKNEDNRIKRFKLTNFPLPQREKTQSVNYNNKDNNNNSLSISKVDDNTSNNKTKKKNTSSICINFKNEDSITNKTQSNQKSNNPFLSITSCDFQDFDYIYLDIDDFNFGHYSTNLMHLLGFIEMLKTNTSIVPIMNFSLKFSPYNEESVTYLLRIFTATDILLFEKRNCFNLMNILYQIKKDNQMQKSLDKDNMYSFFTRDILRRSVYTFKKKICIFIDGFSKLSLLEIPYNSPELWYEYDFTLYPKANHANIRSVNEYKTELNGSYEMYMGIITGTCVGRLIQGGFSSNNFYSVYLVSLEETKRILEMYKNKFDLPVNEEFYLVRIPENKLKNLSKVSMIKQREKKFVLDCVNVKSSSLEKYNPLLDRHLNSFFSSSIIRKDLEQRGLIDEEGYIVNDPVYNNNRGKSLSDLMRHSLSSSNVDKKKGAITSRNEREFLNTIQNLRIWKEPKNKEIDVIYEITNRPTISNVKLPNVERFKFTKMNYGKDKMKKNQMRSMKKK